MPGHIHDVLESNLGDVEEVTGYVKVLRSFPLLSLHFLRSLKTIRGETLDSVNVTQTSDKGYFPALFGAIFTFTRVVVT